MFMIHKRLKNEEEHMIGSKDQLAVLEKEFIRIRKPTDKEMEKVVEAGI